MSAALPYKHSAPFSWREHRVLWNSLSQNEVFDLIVVGGGITGAAVARDASLRGLKVLLVEKGDYASGTSSRSSKLIHGGVRYLEQFEFKLVHESVRERALLWKLAPHLAHPIQFLFPAYKESRVSLWKLNLGLWLYDLLALFRTPSIHKVCSPQTLKKVEPGLAQKDLKGAILYWDGATDDALLTLSNIVDANTLGATTLSRVELKGISWGQEGEAHSVELFNHINQESRTVKGKVIVGALGPWTDYCPGFERFNLGKLLSTTRGSHIVVPYHRLASNNAVVLFHPRDGRVLFTIPWGETTVIGTTDIFDESDPAKTRISPDEVDYLLEAANHYFPEARLQVSDIISTWSGLRPLLRAPEGKSASAISRDSFIEWFSPGLLIVTGGKLTTHREMAESAVNKILIHFKGSFHSPARSLSTRTRPLPSFSYPVLSTTRLGESEASAFDLESVKGICRTQAVFNIEDLFVRRTQIFYKEPDNGLAILKKIKPLLCEELGWDEARWARKYEDYLSYLKMNVYIPLRK